MELSCYQTAWSWLQKIRRGAALAESAACYGTVLFDVIPLQIAAVPQSQRLDVGIALELGNDKPESARVRLQVLENNSPREVIATVNILIRKNTTLLTRRQYWLNFIDLQEHYQPVAPTPKQLAQGSLLLQKTASWLGKLYCGAIDSCHLQSYLDEFCFRHNTASWPDRLAVLDHLLTGLITSTDDSYASTHLRTGGK
jgi:hypothetical protein